MTLIEFVTITEEKVKKELKNKQGLEDTSIITLKLQDPDAINTKVRYLLEASNKEGKKKCVSLNTYYKTYKEDLEKTDIAVYQMELFRLFLTSLSLISLVRLKKHSPHKKRLSIYKQRI